MIISGHKTCDFSFSTFSGFLGHWSYSSQPFFVCYKYKKYQFINQKTNTQIMSNYKDVQGQCLYSTCTTTISGPMYYVYYIFIPHAASSGEYSD